MTREVSYAELLKNKPRRGREKGKNLFDLTGFSIFSSLLKPFLFTAGAFFDHFDCRI